MFRPPRRNVRSTGQCKSFFSACCDQGTRAHARRPFSAIHSTRPIAWASVWSCLETIPSRQHASIAKGPRPLSVVALHKQRRSDQLVNSAVAGARTQRTESATYRSSAFLQGGPITTMISISITVLLADDSPVGMVVAMRGYLCVSPFHFSQSTRLRFDCPAPTLRQPHLRLIA